ncbi:MAG: DNA photolyase [gamma proteobacterium symbiont of Ctena orbiculata]|nr:DNA photolyase [Candidatus Thiodiazotropha sp. (ex Codakia orbicularis)]
MTAKSLAYVEKLETLLQRSGIDRLDPGQQQFLRRQCLDYRFTQQELRQLSDIAVDLAMWGEQPLDQVWPDAEPGNLNPKQRRQRLLERLSDHWRQLKQGPKRYPRLPLRVAPELQRITRIEVDKERLALGSCPVASPRTRCCNLMTLDAVENCGFDCSYCSIQSFYHGDEVRFDRDFAHKLARLELDPQRSYHIGTGQSSDSLMWGNQGGVLDALLEFAWRNPNVILELKSKSKNVSHLLKAELPPNLLCTWSLNTQTLIDHEEHLTAPLEDRLQAARRLADLGVLVGFHLHPMIHYADWRQEYGALLQRLLQTFSAEEVALISLGTLTYIKPVIRQLRERRGFRSKILQMPMVESDGKLSYPREIKEQMFSFAYQSLRPWHGEVFFYLCMENPGLWRPVFGYEYASNQAFETAMMQAYRNKIAANRSAR